MSVASLFHKIRSPRSAQRVIAPPALREPVRFPYGPFRFTCALPLGAPFSVQVCTDLRSWHTLATGKAPERLEFVDSDAAKHSYRFYRLVVSGIPSANILGYAAVSLPPGHSLIANPFDSTHTIADFCKSWPDGTSLVRYDTHLFRMVENSVKHGKWVNPGEKLNPGEGAIFLNPTSEYRSMSFYGEVAQGSLSVPLPAGFSVRSSIVPQPGLIAHDLQFPATDGDVIHVFDRERQTYGIHPFENGAWTAGEPVIGLGEAFWVAKTSPSNWKREFFASHPEPEQSPSVDGLPSAPEPALA